MPKIDVTRFMEQSGMRKARFGGYEPDDVRAALQALCTEYEQRLGRAEAQARKAEQENAALQCEKGNKAAGTRARKATLELTKLMKEAAQNLEFEQAVIYRDKIKALELLAMRTYDNSIFVNGG